MPSPLMTPPPLLRLASASPRRSQLLTRAGIPFERFLAPVDEEALAAAYTGPLAALGEHLARCKALAALEALIAVGEAGDGQVGEVLAADTTVLLDGRSLAKPRDVDEAAAMLRALRGRAHIVATGVALAGPDARRLISATAATRVLMRDYGDDEIAAYVATGDPLDKAGAYSIQHPDFHPVATITGCHLGVIGLPICLVAAMLGRWPADAPGVEAPGVEAPSMDAPPCPWSAACRPPLPPASSIRSVG